MMPESDCIFCKIVRGEIPSVKIHEDDLSLGFLDIFPSSEGHSIIIPKEHFTNIYEIPADLLGRLMGRVKNLATRIRDKLTAKGVNILQNNEAAAGQVVPHFHIHIIPRYGKEILQVSIPKEQAKPEDLQAIAEKIQG